jgi:hypothetical protein
MVLGAGARGSPDDAQRDAPDEVVVEGEQRAPAAGEQLACALAACQHAEHHVRSRHEGNGDAYCSRLSAVLLALETGDTCG